MLFQVKDLAGDTGAIAAILRAHDATAKVAAGAVAGQIDVSAQWTSGQVITARKYVEQMRRQLDELGVHGEDADRDSRFAIDAHACAIYFIGVAE